MDTISKFTHLVFLVHTEFVLPN